MEKIKTTGILLVVMFITFHGDAQTDFRQEFEQFLMEISNELESFVSDISQMNMPTAKLFTNEKEEIIAPEKSVSNENVDVSTEFIQPVTGALRISSHFGYRRDPFTRKKAFHEGIDIPLPERTPVLAARDGVVDKTGIDRHGGKYIKLEHDGDFTTLYAHLSKIMTRKGAKVKQGEIIALSGNTGRSTGPHLHFEVCASEEPINPLLILTQNFKHYEN